MCERFFFSCARGIERRKDHTHKKKREEIEFRVFKKNFAHKLDPFFFRVRYAPADFTHRAHAHTQ